MKLNLAQQLDIIIRKIVQDELKLLNTANSNKKDNLTQIKNSKPLTRIANFSKFGWLKGESTLLKLYNILISYGFISCDFENFKIHFIGDTRKIKNIKWQTYTTRLVYLFDQLTVNKFIPKNNMQHKLLKEHFIDKQGKELNNGCLRSLLNKVLNNKSSEMIETILKELIKN